MKIRWYNSVKITLYFFINERRKWFIEEELFKKLDNELQEYKKFVKEKGVYFVVDKAYEWNVNY